MADANVKEAILAALHENGAQSACSRIELRASLGLDEVSMTQFWAALRSLYYKPGGRRILLSQPRDYSLGTRRVNVVLV